MSKDSKEFVIQTVAGSKVLEVSTQESGEQSVNERNVRAEKMGLDARYVCVPNPAYSS